MRNFILLLVALSAGLACGAKTVLLKGTVGKIPAFVKLEDFDDGSVESRYFYQSSLKDIVLRGQKAGAQYTLYVNGDEAGFDEKWVLRASGTTYSGTWKSRKGKVLPLQFTSIDPKAIENPYRANAYIAALAASDPFEYIRSAFLRLRQDSISTTGGKHFVWLSEVHCNTPFFRLQNGFDASAQEAVNPVLEGIHFERILSQLGCASSFDYNTGNGISFDPGIRYLSKDLLGFEIHSYADDCGAAHPDGGTAGYLIDLHSGRQYELDDILSFHSSVTTEARGGFDAFSKYRSSYLAPAVLKLETQIHKFGKPATEDDCDYREAGLWVFPSWSFTEKGIAFTPIFPRVNRNCEEAFLIPFAALATYKNPKFPYPLAKP